MGGNVTTMEQCLCRVFEAVGIIDKALNVSYMDPVPPFQYVYAAVRANVTNQTSSPGTLGAIVPTWANLLDVMGDSFQCPLAPQLRRCGAHWTAVPTARCSKRTSGHSSGW